MLSYLFLSRFKCSHCFVSGFSCIIMKNIVELKHVRKVYEFEYSNAQKNRKDKLMLPTG